MLFINIVRVQLESGTLLNTFVLRAYSYRTFTRNSPSDNGLLIFVILWDVGLDRFIPARVKNVLLHFKEFLVAGMEQTS